MKIKEINLLEKQRELEKKWDNQKNAYWSGIGGGIFFVVMGFVTLLALPYIVKGTRDESKFLKYQTHTAVAMFAISFVIFALGFYQYSQMKKTEQEIEKLKKELGKVKEI